MITKLVSLVLTGCVGVLIGVSIPEDFSPQVVEIQPESGWSEMDLRAMSCEAGVLLAHKLPLSDLKRAAGLLNATGKVESGSVEEALLHIVQTGEGDRPTRTAVFRRSPEPQVQDWIPISQYPDLSRGH